MSKRLVVCSVLLVDPYHRRILVARAVPFNSDAELKSKLDDFIVEVTEHDKTVMAQHILEIDGEILKEVCSG